MESPAPEDKKVTIGDEGSKGKDLIELVKMQMEMINRLLEDRKEFDREKQSWEEYVDQLKEHFSVNGVEKVERKRSCILAWMGAASFTLLTKVTAARQFESITYENIVEVMGEQYTPRMETAEGGRTPSMDLGGGPETPRSELRGPWTPRKPGENLGSMVPFADEVETITLTFLHIVVCGGGVDLVGGAVPDIRSLLSL
ncbi:hypothetical protein ACOME3_003304 [Neoechinorhynchus agilis]